LAANCVLRAIKAGRERRDTRGGYSNFLHHSLFDQGTSCQRRFGDGHRSPRANLSQVLPMPIEAARQMNGAQQFVRGKNILLVTGVEPGIGYKP